MTKYYGGYVLAHVRSRSGKEQAELCRQVETLQPKEFVEYTYRHS